MKIKTYIKNFFGHLTQVLKHKYWVFHYCRKLGITWRGITHDLSKFSFIEFFSSIPYYQKGKSPIPPMLFAGKNEPWLHHKAKNDHHFEYWIRYINGQPTPVLMKWEAILEMYADWKGATRAYGREWNSDNQIEYVKGTSEIILHPSVKLLLIDFFKYEKEYKNNEKELYSHIKNLKCLYKLFT